MPKDLQKITARATKNVEIAGMRIAPQRLAEPAAPGCSCRGACRSSPSPARPAHRTADDHPRRTDHHPAERNETYIVANAHAAAIGQADLDCPRRRGRTRRCRCFGWCRHRLRHPHRQQPHRLLRDELASLHLPPPGAQQIGIHVVPSRHRAQAGTRLFRLRDNPQLLFHAPATAPLPRAEDLDRAVRHSFEVNLKVGFKVMTLATDQPVSARRSSSDGYE